MANKNPTVNVLSFPSKLIPDLSESSRFLGFIDPDATSFTFQLFDETSTETRKHRGGGEKKRKGQILIQPLEDLSELFTTLNLRENRVIAVAINETDGGRRAEDVTRIRAIFADFDKGLPSNIPLEPSMIVETRPGRQHYYWPLRETWPSNWRGVFTRSS